ncbi:hypothetical protein L6452_37007 [Arctium lappa]|uniref:Uncharacterized protein n=1 Tax=Arctium lappa TaxID=4217 RepID=A0ACB8Y1Q0_ARCLA|nr:hypothetical protein L6452_37007 [Arctium lappa]
MTSIIITPAPINGHAMRSTCNPKGDGEKELNPIISGAPRRNGSRLWTTGKRNKKSDAAGVPLQGYSSPHPDVDSRTYKLQDQIFEETGCQYNDDDEYHPEGQPGHPRWLAVRICHCGNPNMRPDGSNGGESG